MSTELLECLDKAKENTFQVINVLQLLKQLSGDGTAASTIALDDAGADGLRSLLQMMSDQVFAIYEDVYFVHNRLSQQGVNHEQR